MYVLCTLAVLTLHSLLKSWNNKAVEPMGGREAAGRPGDGGVTEVWGASRSRGGGEDPARRRSCRAEGKRRRGGGRKRVQVRRRRSDS